MRHIQIIMAFMSVLVVSLHSMLCAHERLINLKHLIPTIHSSTHNAYLRESAALKLKAVQRELERNHGVSLLVKNAYYPVCDTRTQEEAIYDKGTVINCSLASCSTGHELLMTDNYYSLLSTTMSTYGFVLLPYSMECFEDAESKTKNLKSFTISFDELALTGHYSQDPDEQLVKVQNIIPSIKIELLFKSSYNFTNKKIYPDNAQCYLRACTARKLKKAQEDFEVNYGLSLVIWDTYRPHDIQWLFWDMIQDDRYIADPVKPTRLKSRGF